MGTWVDDYSFIVKNIEYFMNVHSYPCTGAMLMVCIVPIVLYVLPKTTFSLFKQESSE